MKFATTIFARLKKMGVSVDPSSLTKHPTQGLMSTVCSINSNQDDLIIHLIRPVPEWIRQRIWQKISGIGDLLANYPKIPTAPVLLSGKVGEDYFMVQKKLAGVAAGRRLIRGTRVVDQWHSNQKKSVTAIQKIIASVHGIKCEGAGWSTVRNGRLVGRYGSWQKFFETELPLWLRSIKQADRKTPRPQTLKTSFDWAKLYADKFLKNIPTVKSSLIHGDAINPSNILVGKEQITGLLDWEWSLIGDPAWEFCDPGWWPFLDKASLQPYFTVVRKREKINEADFINRTKRYIPLWLMWGCHLHSDQPRGKLYRVLRTMLIESLKIS